jgi:hypothetical protein
MKDCWMWAGLGLEVLLASGERTEAEPLSSGLARFCIFCLLTLQLVALQAMLTDHFGVNSATQYKLSRF